MKKQTIFFLALLFGVVVNQGYAQSYSLNIIKWSSGNISVGVESIDKITFTDSDLFMKYYTGNSESSDMLSIRKITFSNNPSGNVDIIGEEKTISISPHSPNMLRINNLPEGEHGVEIYTITGVLTHNANINSDSPFLNTNQLNKGVFILKVNNQTIKFVMP